MEHSDAFVQYPVWYYSQNLLICCDRYILSFLYNKFVKSSCFCFDCCDELQLGFTKDIPAFSAVYSSPLFCGYNNNTIAKFNMLY